MSRYRTAFHSKKSLLFTLFCLVGSYNVWAQNNIYANKPWAVSLGGAISRKSVIDNNFSSLLYSGNTWGGGIAAKYIQPKVSQEIEAYYATGTLIAPNSAINKLSGRYVNVDYTMLFTILARNDAPFKLAAGGAANLLYTHRKYTYFINSNTSFETATSLSAALAASYDFDELMDGLSVSDKLTVPVLSAVLQPAFGGSYPDNSSVKSYIHNSRLLSFPSFLRLKNMIELKEDFGRNQGISISYLWDFYHIKGAREVKQAGNQVGVSYIFSF